MAAGVVWEEKESLWTKLIGNISMHMFTFSVEYNGWEIYNRMYDKVDCQS